jgi:hypothetical protein
VAQDTDEPDTTERSPDDLARLVEALHPSKEEDERAERFAARLLERPAAAESAPAAGSDAGSDQAELTAALGEANRRGWQRDLLMAAIGAILGVIGTLIVVAFT